MSCIVFINPVTDFYKEVWRTRMFPVLRGKEIAYIPKLTAMIFAALTPERHSFVYVDEEIESVDFDMEADLVALTAISEQTPRAYEIAGEFRKRGKTVVIGGIHASVMPEEAAEHCDALMLGEGENIWPAMLADFENGALKKIYDAKEYPPVETLVSPRIGVAKHDRYLTFPLQATRGCPYDCDFCSIEYSSGHRYRMKPVEQVVAEILEYEKINDNGATGVERKGYYFVDDNLYVNRGYVIELMAALKPLHVKWDCQGTANTAKDDEILQLMADAGCHNILIGFESINPESLAEANKPKINKIDEYHEMIRNVAKRGIGPGGYFIFGFDSDDVGVFQRTLDFIKQSDMLLPFSNLLTPYMGTRLYERLKPRIFDTTRFYYSAWVCVFTPQRMTAEELNTGTRWVGREICDLDFMWTQLKKFWEYGPWERNPRLTRKERFIMLVIALKLFPHRDLMAQSKFALRAALYKKSCDFAQLIWCMRRWEMTKNSQNAKNPKLKQPRARPQILLIITVVFLLQARVVMGYNCAEG